MKINNKISIESNKDKLGFWNLQTKENKNTIPYLSSFETITDSNSLKRIRFLKNIDFAIKKIPLLSIIKTVGNSKNKADTIAETKIEDVQVLEFPELIFSSQKWGALMCTIEDKRCLLCYGWPDKNWNRVAWLYIINDNNYKYPEQSFESKAVLYNEDVLWCALFSPVYSWVADNNWDVLEWTLNNTPDVDIISDQYQILDNLSHKVCYWMGWVFNELLDELYNADLLSKEQSKNIDVDINLNSSQSTGSVYPPNAYENAIKFSSAERTIKSFLKVVFWLNDSIKLWEGIKVLNGKSKIKSDEGSTDILLNKVVNSVSWIDEMYLTLIINNRDFLIRADRDNLNISNISSQKVFNKKGFYWQYSVVKDKNQYFFQLIINWKALKNTSKNISSTLVGNSSRADFKLDAITFIAPSIMDIDNVLLVDANYDNPARIRWKTNWDFWWKPPVIHLNWNNFKNEQKLLVLWTVWRKNVPATWFNDIPCSPVIVEVEDNFRNKSYSGRIYDKTYRDDNLELRILPQRIEDINVVDPNDDENDLKWKLTVIDSINWVDIVNCSNIWFFNDGRVYWIWTFAIKNEIASDAFIWDEDTSFKKWIFILAHNDYVSGHFITGIRSKSETNSKDTKYDIERVTNIRIADNWKLYMDVILSQSINNSSINTYSSKEITLKDVNIEEQISYDILKNTGL